MAEYNQSAASGSDLDTLNGFFKIMFMDKLENLVPEGVKLVKMIPFVKPNKRMGLEYRQPVLLQLEHGVTYGGEEGSAFDLKDAVSGATKEASVKACEMVLRGRVSLGAVSRSINDAASYGRATKHVIKNLLTSTYKKQEQMMFYGKSGLGVVESATYVAPNTEVLIKEETFAPGIWSGAEGMKLDFTSSIGSAPAGGQLEHSIIKVNIRTRKLYIAGDETANILADDIIFEHGAYGNECLGLEGMLKSSASTIFGISTSYSLWNGNVYDLYEDGGAPVGGEPLSFTHVSNAIADAVSKGLEGKIDLFVNPRTWSDLLSEQTAQRMFDSRFDVKKYENGSQSIVFYSQNGMIEIHSSTYVKRGLAFGLDLKTFERVGSSDVTFKIPGTNEDFMIRLPEAHGLEFRTYCDTALFSSAIGHNIIITSIKNS